MKYIEICGNIASGKTTLVRKLFVKDSLKIYENFETNPFYSAFYQNPLEYSFETEITFFLQHYHAIKIKKNHNGFSICDYSLLLDLAYADVNLTGTRHRIFVQIFEEVHQEIGPPESIINLICPGNVLLERIKTRNREAESSITINYLENISQAINYRIKTFSSKTNIIHINSDLIDFRKSSSKSKLENILETQFINEK